MIVIMMVLTFIDVIGRYAFHKPILGGTEVTSALLALTIFSVSVSSTRVMITSPLNCSTSGFARC